MRRTLKVVVVFYTDVVTDAVFVVFFPLLESGLERLGHCCTWVEVVC